MLLGLTKSGLDMCRERNSRWCCMLLLFRRSRGSPARVFGEAAKKLYTYELQQAFLTDEGVRWL